MNSLLQINQRYWGVFTLILWITITILSLSPLDELPSVPGSDKTHHFIAYAALMLPTALRQPRYWLWLGVTYIAYGGLIELLQPYSNRYAEWLDFAANSGGVVLGALLGKALSLYPKPRYNRLR